MGQKLYEVAIEGVLYKNDVGYPKGYLKFSTYKVTRNQAWPFRLGSRIQDVEAFKKKIIYFVPLCLIVFDWMVYPDPKILIFKTEKQSLFSWG